MRFFYTTVFTVFLTISVFGQFITAWETTNATQKILKDINPNLGNSNPKQLASFNGKAYFWAFSPTSGNELWVTDGTPANTQLFKDINPGPSDGYPANDNIAGLTLSIVMDSIMYFSANGGSTGLELWRTNGTAAGTYLVKDICIGSRNSSPTSFYNFNGKVFFLANDSIHGRELWCSDGTTAGTTMFKDVLPGLDSSGISSVYVCSEMNRFFFSARTNLLDSKVWVSDGTAVGTSVLSSGTSGPGMSYLYYNGFVYFGARPDGGGGHELHRTDGTVAGTTLFKDLIPGSTGGFPMHLTVFNGKLFFVVSNSQLWLSDGTALGTVRYSDPEVDTWKGISQIHNADSFLLVYATDSIHGYEPWITRATPNSTFIGNDTKLGSLSGLYIGNIFFSDSVYTYFYSQYAGMSSIWATDGTRNGTFRYTSQYPTIYQNGITPLKVGSNFLITGVSLNTSGHGVEPFYMPAFSESSPNVVITSILDSLFFCDYRVDSLSLSFHTQGEFNSDNQFILCFVNPYYPNQPLMYDTITGISDSVFNISLSKLWPGYGGGYFFIRSTSPPTSSPLSFYPISTFELNLSISATDTLLCTGDTVTLGAALFDTYLWNTGESSRYVNINTPGSYYVKLGASAYGKTCFYNSDTINVISGNGDSITNINTTALVLCNSMDSITLSASIDGMYLWSTGDTSSSIIIHSGGTYSLSVTNQYECMYENSIFIHAPSSLSLSINYETDTLCSPAINLTANIAGGTEPYSYTWNNSSVDTLLMADSAGIYTLLLIDSNGCIAYDTMLILDCPEDVWPGDANNDMACNNMDILALGLAYGYTGSPRANANILWQAQPCSPWSMLTDSVNTKHSDCDGNGIISFDDTLAVNLNYGLLHNKYNAYNEWREGNPVLYINFEQDTLSEGSDLYAQITIGDVNTPVSDLYGLALTFEYDAALFQSEPSVDFSVSDLDLTANLLSIAKIDIQIGAIPLAITRINHTGLNGASRVCRIRLPLRQTLPANHAIISSVYDVKVLNTNGGIIDVNVVVDTANVISTTTAIPQIEKGDFKIYPNPAQNDLTIENSAFESDYNVEVQNVLGVTVKRFALNKQICHLDISGLCSGTYLLMIDENNVRHSKRFIVR